MQPELVGNIKTGCVDDKTDAIVVATHGSLGPIECTATGFVLPDGKVFVTSSFSYGNDNVNRNMGGDQIDLYSVRFLGREESFL